MPELYQTFASYRQRKYRAFFCVHRIGWSVVIMMQQFLCALWHWLFLLVLPCDPAFLLLTLLDKRQIPVEDNQVFYALRLYFSAHPGRREMRSQNRHLVAWQWCASAMIYRRHSAQV